MQLCLHLLVGTSAYPPVYILSVSLRELKHRTMKEPDEPKFQLKEYVDKEMRTAGCCRS